MIPTWLLWCWVHSQIITNQNSSTCLQGAFKEIVFFLERGQVIKKGYLLGHMERAWPVFATVKILNSRLTPKAYKSFWFSCRLYLPIQVPVAPTGDTTLAACALLIAGTFAVEM